MAPKLDEVTTAEDSSRRPSPKEKKRKKKKKRKKDTGSEDVDTSTLVPKVKRQKLGSNDSNATEEAQHDLADQNYGVRTSNPSKKKRKKKKKDRRTKKPKTDSEKTEAAAEAELEGKPSTVYVLPAQERMYRSRAHSLQ